MDSVHGIVCSPQTPYRNTRAFSLPLPVPGENEWEWVHGNGKQTFLLLLSAQDPRNRRKLYWPVINLRPNIRVIIGPDMFYRTYI